MGGVRRKHPEIESPHEARQAKAEARRRTAAAATLRADSSEGRYRVRLAPLEPRFNSSLPSVPSRNRGRKKPDHRRAPPGPNTARAVPRRGRNRGQRCPSADGKRRGGGGGTEGGLLRCLPSCRPREGRAGTPRRATAEAVRHHRHRPGGPAPARRLPRAPAAPGTPLRGTPRSHSAPTAACSVCVYVCVCVRVPPPHRAEEEACERPYPRAALPPATGSSAPTPARKKRTDPAALLPHHHLSPLRSSLGG